MYELLLIVSLVNRKGKQLFCLSLVCFFFFLARGVFKNVVQELFEFLLDEKERFFDVTRILCLLSINNVAKEK